MKAIIKMLPILCLLLQTNPVWAETVKTIEYENQREEVFDLENWLKETTYTNEEVKDTCHKQVPVEEKVCKDETKYKQECKTIPIHEECKNVNHPICHNVTHYEQDCQTPTHRECHTETSPVCHNETHYENVCSTIPSHQQCRDVSEPSCHNETRYEKVCSTGPSRQQCRTVSEPSCHNETRYDNECHIVPGVQQCRQVTHYREECTDIPGRKQCVQIPPDIRCRVINGENKCEKIPAHEECRDTGPARQCVKVPYQERECSTGPDQKECRQVPRQEQVCENRSRQECTTVPGDLECHQVPRQEQVCENHSRQECRTIPSSQDCHQVPRQDQVCENQSRQQCTDVEDAPVCRQVPKVDRVCADHMEKECKNIPAKEECKNVPYKENVCKMETHMKDQAYECMKTVKVPHETVVKTYKAHVQMGFDARAAEVASTFRVGLDTKGKLSLMARGNENTNLLIFAKKDIKAIEHADINAIEALYKIVLMDKNEYFKFMETGIQNLELKKRSLSFIVGGKIEMQRARLLLHVSKNDSVKFEKTILGSEVSSEFDGEKTKITVDLKKLGAKKLRGFFFREYNVQMKLTLDYSDLGESILQSIPEFSTSANINVNVE